MASFDDDLLCTCCRSLLVFASCPVFHRRIPVLSHTTFSCQMSSVTVKMSALHHNSWSVDIRLADITLMIASNNIFRCSPLCRSGIIMLLIAERTKLPDQSAMFVTHLYSYRVFTQSSKRPALARVFWIHLLEVCWTLAGSCKHPINKPNNYSCHSHCWCTFDLTCFMLSFITQSYGDKLKRNFCHIIVSQIAMSACGAVSESIGRNYRDARWDVRQCWCWLQCWYYPSCLSTYAIFWHIVSGHVSTFSLGSCDMFFVSLF